ncbi:hypothetical protein LEMLEM_LOCUS8555 [Lemmus lemmus]
MTLSVANSSNEAQVRQRKEIVNQSVAGDLCCIDGVRGAPSAGSQLPAPALPTLPYSALLFPAPGTVSGSETRSPKRTAFPQEDPEVVCPVSTGKLVLHLGEERKDPVSLSRAQYCALGT